MRRRRCSSTSPTSTMSGRTGCGSSWPRQWAGAGIRSLRLDLSGLGDSPDRQGRRAGGSVSSRRRSTTSWTPPGGLSPDDPSNVVLVGLCSGGYQALESALALRARGVVAINPFGPSTRPSSVPASRSTRAGGSSVPDRRADDEPARELPGPKLPARGWPGQPARIASSGRSSGRWLSDLVQQGTDTLLVCGDAELRAVRRRITAARLQRLSRTGGCASSTWPASSTTSLSPTSGDW